LELAMRWWRILRDDDLLVLSFALIVLAACALTVLVWTALWSR
jgi:hypothetical protein